MEQHIQKIIELRARADQRRIIWLQTVKNRVLSQLDSINNQLYGNFKIERFDNFNRDSISISFNDFDLKIKHEGNLVILYSSRLWFSQLVNGKIAIFIERGKIETLEVLPDHPVVYIDIFEPEALMSINIADFVGKLLVDQIDIENLEEDNIRNSNEI